MENRSVREDVPGGFRETGVVVHEGREFASGGAFVSDSHLICYPRGPESYGSAGDATAWNGEVIGRYRVTGTGRGFRAVRLRAYRVTLADGREYVGKGLGSGMILKCRRAATPRGSRRCA